MKVDEFSQITSNIFISSQKSAQNLELLKKYKITHILSILKNTSHTHPNTALVYKLITHIEDTPDNENSTKLAQILPETNIFIHSTLTSNPENKICYTVGPRKGAQSTNIIFGLECYKPCSNN